LRTEGQNSIR